MPPLRSRVVPLLVATAALAGSTACWGNRGAAAVDQATRDSLSFRDLDVRLVAPELAQVVARWVLTRGDSIASSGWTSLLMRRGEERWRIVHDHSS